MSRYRPYEELSDFLVYCELSAPDFSNDKSMNLERAFEKVFLWLDEIRRHERNASALTWLNLCAKTAQDAKSCYQKADSLGGRQNCQDAFRYLSNAHNRVPTTPDFIAGPDGEVRRNPLSGPNDVREN